MNVLLDECIAGKLKNSLAGHDCRTASEVGLAGRKNGEVLSLAERLGFEIFVTMDKGVEYEQNLTGRKIAIINTAMAGLPPGGPQLSSKSFVRAVLRNREKLSLPGRELDEGAPGGGQGGVPRRGVVPAGGIHRDQPGDRQPGSGAVL